ncbi:MAG: DNA (cytosine-5-)-methyltransferase [Candidatus Pacearchaeota archaeon]
MENDRQKEIRYFSMFTGVGGFELGFQKASRSFEGLQERREVESDKETQLGHYRCVGFFERANNLRPSESDLSKRPTEYDKSENKQLKWKCVGFSETDKHASKLLEQKFPNVKNYGDASKIRPEDLPEFDLLCGGFPCQTFSIAGKRRGFEDTRGTMFFEIERILKVKRPSYILLENVKGLLSHQKGHTFRIILERLQELGYNVEWMVLNSKFFGVPQNRERVFIVGSFGNKPRLQILPFGKNSKESFKESEKGLELEYDGDYQSKRIYSVYGVAPTIPVSKTGGNHIPFIKEQDKKTNRG